MIRGAALAVIVVSLQVAGTMTLGAQSVSLVPSFGITQVYDGNVFYRPAAEGDTATRFSSRLDSAYTSDRLTVSGRYALDVDRFAGHPELTTAHGRQEAGVDAQYHSSRRVSFSGSAAFTESQTPTDLNQETALAPGRVRAQRFTVRPSATYEFGRRTEATAGYTMTGDRLAGGVSLLMKSATSTLEHHLSTRSDLRVDYTYQHYLFERVETRTSQALTAGWTQGLNRLTSLSLRVGPRLTGGSLSPEIAVSLHRQLRGGDASLAYARTQTTLIGLAGTADTHSLTATLGGEPRPGLRLRAGPGVLHTKQADLSSVVYRLSVSCARPIASRLAIEAAYDMNLQRGNIYTARDVATIGRNLVLVKLVVADTTTAR